MSEAILSSKKIANSLSKGTLYIPKGFILPIVQFIDESRQLLKHDHVACAFCQRNLPPPEPAKSKLTAYVNSSLDAFEHINFKMIMWYFALVNLLISKLFPEIWVNAAISKIEKISDKYNNSAENLTELLKKYQTKIVWYGLIPFF